MTSTKTSIKSYFYGAPVYETIFAGISRFFDDFRMIFKYSNIGRFVRWRLEVLQSRLMRNILRRGIFKDVKSVSQALRSVPMLLLSWGVIGRESNHSLLCVILSYCESWNHCSGFAWKKCSPTNPRKETASQQQLSLNCGRDNKIKWTRRYSDKNGRTTAALSREAEAVISICFYTHHVWHTAQRNKKGYTVKGCQS